MKGFPDLPPVWWLGSIALIYMFKALLPSWHISGDGLQVVSRIILISALAIVAWSAIWFFRKKTPIEPHHTPKSLIVEGPYKLSRNPIYLALVMLTVASAVGNGSAFGIAVAVAFWWVLDRRFAEPEEATLLRTFGDEAKDYMAQTRRWF